MGLYLLPLIGGAIIGVAISLMLYLNGRVTGVSGIVSGALDKKAGDFAWRLYFIGGLILGGVILRWMYAESLVTTIDRGLPLVVLAGLLVGFGTVMGGGCTSGHGICGLSRFSPRSLAATGMFMLFGVIAATLYRLLTGGA